MLLGEFADQREPMLEADPLFSMVWFWSFYFVMFYLLINMLLAIVMDAYVRRLPLRCQSLVQQPTAAAAAAAAAAADKPWPKPNGTGTVGCWLD